MITRSEYMADSANLHQAYYLEIAEEAGLRIPPGLLSRAKAVFETDSCFNKTPLAEWDSIAIAYRSSLQRALKPRGECWSLGAGVCAAKALARHLVTTDA